MDNITWAIETITPEQAAYWLEHHNPNNRSVSKGTVELYARQMREGKWAVNGESLQFDSNGNMMNGQHRLHAVVAAGVPVLTTVVRGLDPEVKNTLDQHRKRTAGDVLMMHGYTQGNALAAIVRTVARWDEGVRSGGLMGTGLNMLTADEVLEFISKEPLCEPAVHASKTKEAALLTTGRAYGTLWVLSHRADYDQAEEFFRRVTTGEMLEAGNPILTLRRYWLNVTASGRTANRKVRTDSSFADLNAGVRAWNAWCKGETMNKLSWKTNAIPEVLSP